LKKRTREQPFVFRELEKHCRGAYDEEEIIEFIRLVTPNFHKVRLDTQYFVMNCKEENLWNIHSALKEASQKHDTNNLIIDEGYDSILWGSPAKLMSMYLAKDINLSTNEVIIINILMSFKRYSDLISYLKTVQYNCLNSFSENILDKRCLTFPFNIGIVKASNDPVLKKKGIVETAYFEGDFDYPFLDSLKSQKEGKWKQELKMFYSKVKNNQDSRQRFFLSNIKKIPWVPSESDVYLPYEMPLKLLKGYQEIKAGIGYGSF